MNANELLQILTLINALEPAGVALVKTLATKLQGKTDEEIKAIGDGLDDAGEAKADAEISST